jgi:hypothetical protein
VHLGAIENVQGLENNLQFEDGVLEDLWYDPGLLPKLKAIYIQADDAFEEYKMWSEVQMAFEEHGINFETFRKPSDLGDHAYDFVRFSRAD